MIKKPHQLTVTMATHMFMHRVGITAACKRAGVHPSTWSRWASGGPPDVPTYDKLMQAIDEIIAERDSASTPSAPGAAETGTGEHPHGA